MKKIEKNYPEWQVYYKPHPSEIKDFPKDFNNINVITDYKNFLSLVSKSTHNIGIFQAVMYIPLILNKNIVTLDHSFIGANDELDFSLFKEGSHELNFWKNILPQYFTNFKEFKKFISIDFINKTLKRNKKLEQTISKNLVSYNKDHTFMDVRSNNSGVLTYYDDYNDNKASERIIDYLEYYEKN